MKRNLILTLVLILLVALTWWFQERGGEVEKQEQAKQELIFDPKEFGGLISIHFADVDLYPKGEDFFVGENRIPANPYKIQEMFEALNGLSVIRRLSDEEARTVNTNLAFEQESLIKIYFKTVKKDVNFLIGSKLATHSSRFYGRLGSTILVLEDRRPLFQAYNPEEEGELKHHRLHDMFTIHPEFFYDTRIFTEPVSIARAAIDNPRVRSSLKVNFKTKKTEPTPMNGLGYDLVEFDRWKTTLEGLEAKTIFPTFDLKLLKSMRAGLKITTADGEKVELTLFSGYGSLPGDFVISNQSKFLFELADNQAGIFFQNVQDFWDIRFIQHKSNLDMSLSGEKMTVALRIDPAQVFNVEINTSYKLEPRRDRLEVLYSLLTSRPRYITDLIDLSYKEHFVIKADKRTVVFGEVPNQWLLVDSANKLAYYYNKHDYPDLASDLSQYFGQNE